MMGYRVPHSYAAGYPGQMYMMGTAGRDSHVASLSNRLPQPVSAAASEPYVTGGVAAAKVSSTATVGDAAAQSNTAAASAGTSKSKQGLEKILDILGKMFPDIRTSVTIPFSRVLKLEIMRCSAI